MLEQLTRTRTSPRPDAPLTKSPSVPAGDGLATWTSAVPIERESSCTQVESLHRQIEMTCVQVAEDLPLYVAASDDVVLLTPVNVPYQVAVFVVPLVEPTTR